MSWRAGWVIIGGSIGAWVLVLWFASCAVSARVGVEYEAKPASAALASSAASE